MADDITGVSREEMQTVIIGRQMRELVQHRYWLTYIDGLIESIRIRERELRGPTLSVEEVLTAQFKKGIISGIELCLAMPQATIEEMNRLVQLADEQGKSFND